MVGRKPDYDVAALDKETEERGRIGAAWKNDDGSISVAFNAFTQLRVNKHLVFTLFPITEGKKKTYGSDTPVEPKLT